MKFVNEILKAYVSYAGSPTSVILFLFKVQPKVILVIPLNSIMQPYLCIQGLFADFTFYSFLNSDNNNKQYVFIKHKLMQTSSWMTVSKKGIAQ